MISGYYYLHTEGDLIYKPAAAVDGDPEYFRSDFVQRVWPVDTSDRIVGWRILLEALAAGAKPKRILELAAHWRCDLDDLIQYMGHEHGADGINDERREGLDRLLTAWGIEPAELFARVEATPPGELPDLADFRERVARARAS